MYQNRTFTVSAHNHCTDLKHQCFDKCLSAHYLWRFR